ncbi:MAG: DnaJ domain-containing protein [Verrucomicrobiae bacterium]|nr:DnaJ domain-containing protein [Verrucomicrobiae bacterium]
MNFSDMLPWFREPGFVALSLASFAGGFLVGLKAKPVWQVVSCIFFGSFLITRWSEGEVWSMALWWVYAGWCGYLFQKIGGGGLLEGIAIRIRERMRIFAEGGGNSSSSPQPFHENGTDPAARREQEFRERQNAYEQRQRRREEQERRHRTEPEPERKERKPPPEKPRSEIPPSPTKRPWWEVLEVPREADKATIKKAYREKVRKYHPDMVSHLGDEFRVIAEQKAKEINTAYSEAGG